MTTAIFPSNTFHSSRTNYTNDFEIELQKPIDGLNRDAYIEVTNISFPNTISNILNDECFFSLTLEYSDLSRYNPFESVDSKSRFSYNGYNIAFKFETDKILIKNGVYNLPDLIQVINTRLEEYGVKIHKNSNNKIVVTWNSYFEIWVKQLKSVSKNNLNDMNLIMKRNSYGSYMSQTIDNCVVFLGAKSFDNYDVNTFHQYNSDKIDLSTILKPNDPLKSVVMQDAEKFKDGFYSTVKMNLNFSDSLKWILGFDNNDINFTSKIKYDEKDILFTSTHSIEASYLPDIRNAINSLYIYCDQIEDSIVGNHNSNLLALIPLKNEGNIEDLEHYSPPASKKKLKKNIINSIRFTVCDSGGKLINFNYGNINIETSIE